MSVWYIKLYTSIVVLILSDKWQVSRAYKKSSKANIGFRESEIPCKTAVLFIIIIIVLNPVVHTHL